MIWPVLLPLILLFCCYKDYWGIRKKLQYPPGIISPFVLLGILGILIVGCISIFFRPLLNRWQEKPAVVQLASLKEGGKEFLVHEYGYYIYRTENQLWYENAKVKDSLIEFKVIEEPTPSGRLEIYWSEFSSPWLWLIAFDVANKVKYEFHIPKGSLSQ